MTPKAGMTFVEALTFDDVLLRPGHSEVMPSGVDLSRRFTRTIALPALAEEYCSDWFRPRPHPV